MTEWKDCGYLKPSKDKKTLFFKIKNKSYIVHTNEWQEVLEGKKPYALIYEAVEEGK